MKPANVRIIAALSPVLCASGALAQPADPLDGADIRSEQIVVTANRTARPISQVGASVTVIAEDEIVTRQPSDVLDILRTVPGVSFNRNGGIGGTAGLAIRGAESDQTVVLVDGIKLNDPAAPGGGFDFGPLAMGNIARVEVVRGSQSVLYGSQAIGGVVNLITRAPSADPDVFVRAEYGERDTAQLVGNVAGRLGPVGASLGATYLRTDGISAFNEARGGTEADGFESVGVNGKVEVALGDAVALDLRGFYADSEAEVDGFPAPLFAFADTPELSSRTDFVGYAGLNASLIDGRLRNRLGFAYTNIDRRSVEPSEGSEFETFDANGENRRYEYQGVFDAAGFAQLVFGAEREESAFRTASFGGAPEFAESWINGFYGQLNLTPLAGLSLTGGVRHDDHETFGAATTFAASGAYSPNGGATVLRASYGEGFKAPSLFQLYSIYGNRALRPEESEGWDAGISHRFLGGRAGLGVTYFERDTDNLIGFVSTATPPFGFYGNTARATASGWEAGLALRPVNGFDVALNYTRIDAFDAGTSNRLARRAGDKASLVADYRLPGGLGLGATVLLVGDSFDDPANTRRLDGYVLADIRASYGLTDALEIYGRIENLFDARYETAFLYGQPGRAAIAGVRYRL